MCLKKKKNIKKKKEISVRSASRLDDKEKHLVSKEIHAVFNEHMDKRKIEFKPANIEEIDILVRDIKDDEFVIEESIKKENHIGENVSIHSKALSSKKSSRKNSTTKSHVSCNSKENIIIENLVLSNTSIISNTEEETISNHLQENHSKSFGVEVQEKQIDLSSECSIDSNENKKISTKHIVNESEIILKNETKFIENEIIHSKIIDNQLIENEVIHSKIIDNQLIENEKSHDKSIEKLNDNQFIESNKSHGKSFEKLNDNQIETLELSQELKKESLIHHSEQITNNTKIIDKESMYLGYYIPDNESICHNNDSFENISNKHIDKNINNLVENIEDTMNTVKNLVGEKKLEHSEDVNNNYHTKDYKDISIKSTTFEKENVQLESLIDKTKIINSKETNIEEISRENIITTTFYEEILQNKEDKLNYACTDNVNLHNSTNHLKNIEKTSSSNMESIEQSNTNIKGIYHDKNIIISHGISNNSLNKHNEESSDKKIINKSHASSIHSKNDKHYDSTKKNSINCLSMSNVSSVYDDFTKKDSSIVSKQSKSRNYSPIEYKSKEIINSSEIKKQSFNDINYINNNNDISLIYKPKRRAESIKSIESNLSYGFPTKKHVIKNENYNEIKKITEYQVDNKMKFIGKCNGYYLMKPQMIESVCKYTEGIKIIIGGDQKKSLNDKKIILFGTKGSGKTTLINNYCNILYGVGRECNFRFVINSPNQIEPTKNIVTYEFNNTILGYKFTIIDTPGFDINLPVNETFSYKNLYDVYLKNYISKANRILIHGVSIVIRNEDDIWNSKFYRQISGIRRIFCGNYENKNLYPIVTNAKAFSKLNYFDENIQGIYNQNTINNNFKTENKIRKHTMRRANWYTDVFRITSNIYEKNFEGKKTLDKVYLFNETEAAFDKLFNALQYNLPILLKKKQGNFETIYEY